ncbi:MAG TPA: CopG family transcriptional regulator [Gemmatimonadota bacterium]|nr:CopG family transcriptional regulator [Gemmatimonadota bacterium]
MTKRATIYLDDELHRALKLKSATTDRTISELVNEAVRRDLAEDADDLAAFEEREDEPVYTFEEVVRTLRERGKL